MSRISLLAVVVAAVVCAAPAGASAACTSSTPSAAAYTDPVDGDSAWLRDHDGQGLRRRELPLRRRSRDRGSAGRRRRRLRVHRLGRQRRHRSHLPRRRRRGDRDRGAPHDRLPAAARRVERRDVRVRRDDAGRDAVGNGGFSASVDALAVASGTTTNLMLGSLRVTDDDVFFDLAPDAGAISLPVTWSAAAASTKRTDLRTPPRRPAPPRAPCRARRA